LAVERLLDRFYPIGQDGLRFRDGTAPFYDWFLGSVGRDATVLNIGAGPTPPERRRVRGKFKRVVGVDPDPVVLTNSDLDEAHVNDGTALPFANDVFDAAFSDWTLEHVAQPVPFLREVARVLTPGGSFWARTPNKRHYVTLISAHTPHWFHRLTANRARHLPGDAHEPWPTHYRMNTPALIRSASNLAGFESVQIRLIEPEPRYVRFNPMAFLAGVGYERVVNRFERLAGYRLILLVRMQKSTGQRSTAGGSSTGPP
jgi:SAM-dependent methyltransferase